MRETSDPKHCRALRDDYLECLHHRKEVGTSLRKYIRLYAGEQTLTGCNAMFGQFTRLNAVYRERKKQLAEGVDVLKDRLARE